MKIFITWSDSRFVRLQSARILAAVARCSTTRYAWHRVCVNLAKYQVSSWKL